MKLVSLQQVLFFVCICPGILAFRFSSSQLTKFSLQSSSSKLYNTNNNNKHSFDQHTSKVSKVIASALGLLLTVASPAYAFGELESANNKLSNYGLPPILFVPPNFTPIVSEFGRGNAKEQMTNPVVVEFSHPSLWVTATTTVNNNGESGTISANGM